MIKILLWDIDGTVLNFMEAEKNAIRMGFAEFSLGTCTDEMLRVYSAINEKYWQRLERGEMSKPEILVSRFREFFSLYHLPADAAEEFNRRYQTNLGETICFNDNAGELIDGLKNRVFEYAVTNGTEVAQEKKLRRSGLGRVFDDVFISERLGAEKPSREFFRQVFAAIGNPDPDEVMIIGDSLTSDMPGGLNAGIRTCWYNPAHLPQPEGMMLDYVIDDLSAVPGILDREGTPELWDVLDSEHRRTGRRCVRGTEMAPEDYHQVVHICIFNEQGEMLIQQRTAAKKEWPSCWDVSTGGSALAGETSRQAAARELYEELGIQYDFSTAEPVMTVHDRNIYDDFFAVVLPVDLSRLRLQKEEVARVRWADYYTVRQMIAAGTFIPYRPGYLEVMFASRGLTGAIERYRG
ncbi:MAG: YjjG family noncanonical pyrimidine nucleotidase [Solobacterium sp.]|nr:YjjG family noncanonical pyrimidine nucleotidase [Solobacterium sp.]